MKKKQIKNIKNNKKLIIINKFIIKYKYKNLII